MAFPPSFRALVRMLFLDAQLQIKVNGVRGPAFAPLNGVKQGCPLSPLLYLLSLQPLRMNRGVGLAKLAVVVAILQHRGEEISF